VPEINLLQQQHSSVLRKTHSQPHTKNQVGGGLKAQTLAAITSTKAACKSTPSDPHPHPRAKSMPGTTDCDVRLVKNSVEAKTSVTRALFAKLRSDDRKIRSKSGSPQLLTKQIQRHNIAEGIRSTLTSLKSRSQEDLSRIDGGGGGGGGTGGGKAESGGDGSSYSDSDGSTVGGATASDACVASSSIAGVSGVTDSQTHQLNVSLAMGVYVANQ